MAEALADDLRAFGWEPEIFYLQDEWHVAADGRSMLVSHESIAELRRSAEDLAAQHGAVYHGWQTSLDPGMSI